MVGRMEERVMDLEIRLAYQDKKIGELDALVQALAARLATAERDLAELKLSMTSDEAIATVDERPPHY